MTTEHPNASLTQTGSEANLIERTPPAYDYPLLIKHLLHTPLAHAPEQEIVYRDLHRYDYRTLRHRIGQLASGLESLGVRPGDTVAVLDWDSHRYLECYFAVPMMGAVLQMVNIRLSPEQILYTINDAESDVLLVGTDFLPVLEEIQDQFETVKKIVLLTDGDEQPETLLEIASEYEELVELGSPEYEFPDFDENTRATTFHTTGTTGNPKGVYFSHRQLVLHTLAGPDGPGYVRDAGPFSSCGCVYAYHADVPRACLGNPLHGDRHGRQAGLSGSVRAGDAARSDREGEGYLLSLCANHTAHAPQQRRGQGGRPQRLDGDHRRFAAAQGDGQDRFGARDRRVHGVRYV